MSKKKSKYPIITPAQWFDSRFYRIDLSPQESYQFPSVTTLLGALPNEGLLRHYGDLGYREAQRRLEELGNSGSRVHHAIYCYVNGGVILYQPPWNKRQIWKQKDVERYTRTYGERAVILQDQREMLNASKFVDWFQELKPQVMGSELTVYSLKHKFAGTLDQIYLIDEDRLCQGMPFQKGVWIYDAKTGQERYTHKMQVSAYDVALRENEIAEPVGAILHYLSKNKIVLMTRNELDKGFNSFLKVAAVWNLLHPDEEPDVFSFPSYLSVNKPLKQSN